MGIIGLELNNFKTIKHASVDFKDSVTGIYGENGIGKTSILDAINLFKDDLIASSIENEGNNFDEYIKDFEKRVLSSVKVNNQKMSYLFNYQIDNYVYTFFKEYNISNHNSVHEKVSYYNINKKLVKHDVFERTYHTNQVDTAFNYTIFEEPNSIDISELNNIGLRKITSLITPLYYILKRYKDTEYSSSRKMRHLNNISDFLNIITRISYIDVKDQAITNLGIIMPMHIHKNGFHSTLMIKQFDTFYREDKVQYINSTIDDINKFLKVSLNGRQLVLEIHKERLSPDGEIEQALRLDVIQPDGGVVNINNESTGIVKMISIFSSFTELIKNENYIVLIDELDSHVYEYLLAILVKELSTNIKGKLIFTSHNLTLLERLEKQSIVISQRDKVGNVEFIRFKKVSNTTNLRDVYLRALFLGDNDITPLEIDDNDISAVINSIYYGVGHE